MATLKQSAAGIWRVRFRYSGRQFFRSCETTEEKAANQVLTRVDETLSLLKTGRLTLPPDVDGEGVGDFIVSGGKVTAKTTIKETHTLKQVVADYFASTPAGAKSVNSIATERTHLDHFVRIIGHTTPIDSIGVGELQAYVTKRSKEKGIRGRKVQPETLRKELVTFGTMRRWAKARGWCDGDIDRRAIKLPKGTDKAPFRTWAEIESIVEKGGLTDVEQRDLWDCLFLCEKEVSAFLDYVAENGKAPWLHPALAIAALTGARRSEIMRSEIRDFDLTRGIATLREKKRKQSKSLSYRTVDIHPRLAEILKAWFANHPGGKYTVCAQPNVPLVPDEALRTFEQTVAGGKWKVLRGWHVLRHSFASICAMKGVRESTISSWMGHETDAMKQRYRHLFPDVRKAEMGRVFS
jgi:integrase